MKLIYAIVLAVFLFSGVAGAELVINEILAAPSSDWNGDGVVSYRDDEWVEIYNPGDSEVNAVGYRIADGETTWRYELSGVIPPHGFRVVYGSDSYAWEKAKGFPLYGLSLNNTGDVVRLFKVTQTETVLVDCHTYNKYEAASQRSTGRVPDGYDEWIIYDSLNPYSGEVPPFGSACSPTPNSTNGCPNPTNRGTWGRIKALYK